jgi:hypothetical protein
VNGRIVEHWGEVIRLACCCRWVSIR